jgi:hypothetical protein
MIYHERSIAPLSNRQNIPQEASRIAAASAAAASSGLPSLSTLDILQQQAQQLQPAGDAPLPANGSTAHHAAGLRPPQQQHQQLPVPVPTAGGEASHTSPLNQPPAAPQERMEALSLSEQEPQPATATATAAVAAQPPPLLPELPCTPQGGFGTGGREQTPLMAPDAKVFTVHVGNTYSQADYHVESLLEVRRLLRDFASISFRQTSRTGGR